MSEGDERLYGLNSIDHGGKLPRGRSQSCSRFDPTIFTPGQEEVFNTGLEHFNPVKTPELISILLGLRGYDLRLCLANLARPEDLHCTTCDRFVMAICEVALRRS